MSDLGWITLGYSVVYGVVAVYAGFLVRRVADARRRVETPGSSGTD